MVEAVASWRADNPHNWRAPTTSSKPTTRPTTAEVTAQVDAQVNKPVYAAMVDKCYQWLLLSTIDRRV